MSLYTIDFTTTAPYTLALLLVEKVRMRAKESHGKFGGERKHVKIMCKQWFVRVNCDVNGYLRCRCIPDLNTV